VKVLPAEVVFVGTTVMSDARPPGEARFLVAVRAPSGLLLPVTDTPACLWGTSLFCDAAGDDTREETLESGEPDPAWNIRLESGREVGLWGDYEAYEAVADRPPSLTQKFHVRVLPDGNEGGAAFVVSVRSDKGVLENARYSCVPLK
jgi:hypothetical protein